MSGLAAIILAGGRSRRMGRDKALLRWGRRTAIERVARLAKDAGARAILVAGADYGLPFVSDPTPNGGPVGGLLAAAACLAGAERLLVLAVDAPTLTLADLRPLLAACGPGAIYLGNPLPMVVALSALPFDLPAASSLRRLAELAGLSELPPRSAALPRLRGANTPDEFESLRA
jgi:molybdopterin-guanine dinucleotide biosynthesis protein A